MGHPVLITGATDGLGRDAAERLVAAGVPVLVHGRSEQKLAQVAEALRAVAPGAVVEPFRADLSQIGEVEALAEAVLARHPRLRALVNNAGVLRTETPRLANGLDVRVIVNAAAPVALARRLAGALGAAGRVVNLSSAAQASVDLARFEGRAPYGDAMAAYAQSKLALTMWSGRLGRRAEAGAPVLTAVNPGSMLATKMVKEGFGVPGRDAAIGAEIIVQAVLDDAFAGPSGRYFDNDAGAFADPHADALDDAKCDRVIESIDRVLERAAAG